MPQGLRTEGPDPELPEDLDLRLLPRGVKAELRGLPVELADKVGPRLLAAGQLIDLDPQLAYAHAQVARRLASRLPIVRNALGETAYAAGEYAVALSEYRALRRMTGANEYLPVMADCERALGKPQEALKLAREASSAGLDEPSAVEMRIVEAGARADLGQHAEAVRLLENEIQRTKRVRGLSNESQARLRYAYADQLLAEGNEAAARTWFEAAAKLDPEGETDAADRLAELDGLVIHFDETDEEEELAGTDPGDPTSDSGAEALDTGEAVTDAGEAVTDAGEAVTDSAEAVTDSVAVAEADVPATEQGKDATTRRGDDEAD